MLARHKDVTTRIEAHGKEDTSVEQHISQCVSESREFNSGSNSGGSIPIPCNSIPIPFPGETKIQFPFQFQFLAIFRCHIIYSKLDFLKIISNIV